MRNGMVIFLDMNVDLKYSLNRITMKKHCDGLVPTGVFCFTLGELSELLLACA